MTTKQTFKYNKSVLKKKDFKFSAMIEKFKISDFDYLK